jgi:hypothetical protein
MTNAKPPSNVSSYEILNTVAIPAICTMPIEVEKSTRQPPGYSRFDDQIVKLEVPSTGLLLEQESRHERHRKVSASRSPRNCTVG